MVAIVPTCQGEFIRKITEILSASERFSLNFCLWSKYEPLTMAQHGILRPHSGFQILEKGEGRNEGQLLLERSVALLYNLANNLV